MSADFLPNFSRSLDLSHKSRLQLPSSARYSRKIFSFSPHHNSLCNNPVGADKARQQNYLLSVLLEFLLECLPNLSRSLDTAVLKFGNHGLSNSMLFIPI